MAVEAPSAVTEHPLALEAVEIQADGFMLLVAQAFGLSLGEDTIVLKRVVREAGRLIEDLSFQWSPYEHSVLSINRPGEFNLIVIPKHNEGRNGRHARIDYRQNGGQALFNSEEASNEVRKALLKTLPNQSLPQA